MKYRWIAREIERLANTRLTDINYHKIITKKSTMNLKHGNREKKIKRMNKEIVKNKSRRK